MYKEHDIILYYTPPDNKRHYVLIRQTQPNITYLLNKNKLLFIGTARQSVQQVLLNNIIKKKLVERANLGHGSL